MSSLAEVELLVTIFPTKIATPEETQGVLRYSRVRFQTNTVYTQSMSVNQYETVSTQLECEDTLHPDAHMFLCQELIEEAPDTAEVIMIKLSLKEDMKCWKGEGKHLLNLIRIIFISETTSRKCTI